MKRSRSTYIPLLILVLVTILIGCSGVNDNINAGKSRVPIKIDAKRVEKIIIEPFELSSEKVELTASEEIDHIVAAFNSGKEFRTRDWGTTEKFRVIIQISDHELVVVKDARIDSSEGTVMVDVVNDGFTDSMSMKSKELLDILSSYKDQF